MGIHICLVNTTLSRKEFMMTRWHGGKGQTQRPVDKEKFESEFDRIFNKDKGKKDESRTNKSAGDKKRTGER